MESLLDVSGEKTCSWHVITIGFNAVMCCGSLTMHGYFSAHPDLGGVGHPLVDSLLEESRSATLAGEVAAIGANGVFARYFVRRRDDRRLIQSRVITMLYEPFTGQVQTLQHFPTDEKVVAENGVADFGPVRAAIESNLEVEINNWLPSRQSRIGLNISLVGLHQ